MKTWAEIMNRLDGELQQWFVSQCRNPFEDYYLYYLQSTAEHNGGFLIARKAPANSEYKLAVLERLAKGQTIQQNKRKLLDVLRKLPILDI